MTSCLRTGFPTIGVSRCQSMLKAQSSVKMSSTAPGTQLWQHPKPKATQMWEYMQTVNSSRNLQLASYEDLHAWSTSHIVSFWQSSVDYLGVTGTDLKCQLKDESLMFPKPNFFPDAKLNFAQNLLYPAGRDVDPEALAVIAATETTRQTVTWRELRSRVALCQRAMRNAGISKDDRVAGFVANHTNALVAMLAVTSIGAIWTAISPDTGVTAVLDRWRQIEPAILFCDNAVMYNGKTHATLPKVLEISHSLPSLRHVVIFETVEAASGTGTDDEYMSSTQRVQSYSSFLSTNAESTKQHMEPQFEQLPADHPVYILYSSGTTGAPKCIVHGAIGTLLQHKKEHVLHCDLRPGDRFFYFTTCTWMMWHWLVSGLASGATLILYDGSPFRYLGAGSTSNADDLAMPRLIQELKITHFGTSAKYLSMLEQKSLVPSMHSVSLSSLKAIYSTGSPLAPSTFAYVYSSLSSSINLGSITGGTDIISLFGAPCPLTPVYCGEIQVAGLGMSIRAYDSAGQDITASGEPGDLVCTKPFICQPVTFWGPGGPDKYRSSYFDVFGDHVWHHGDFVRFNPRTGGIYMLGRSDGTLKPSGVRFGSAEIYNLLLSHFAAETEDALCIGRRRESDTDETVVLFLKMRDGVVFDQDLVGRIKACVRTELSARHVPGIIDQAPEIPVTTNGKKVEGAVKQILCGINVKTSASVANVECLDWYRQWAADHP